MRPPRRVPVPMGARMEVADVMDPYGRIYRAPKDEIPAEDESRLDGYRRAYEELGRLKEYEQKLLAAERRMGSRSSVADGQQSAQAVPSGQSPGDTAP